MNPLIRKVGEVAVLHTVKGFVEPIQRLEYGFIQSCVLDPASSTIQCSVLESSWILPAGVIGLTMLGPCPLDPTFHAIKSSAHPPEPALWLEPRSRDDSKRLI